MKIITIIIAIIFAAILSLPHILPMQEYEKNLILAAKYEYDIELEINGGFELKLYPAPMFVAKDVSAYKYGLFLAKAENVQAKISLLHLLNNELEVSHLKFDGFAFRSSKQALHSALIDYTIAK